MVRGLLFEAAKVLLSRSARPSRLKTWGEALGKRIGLKKATMAVARKLDGDHCKVPYISGGQMRQNSLCRPIRPTAIQTNWSGNTSRPTLSA